MDRIMDRIEETHEESLTEGEQERSSLVDVIRLLVRVRRFFLLAGAAFLVWKVSELFWTRQGVTLNLVVEATLVSVVGPAVVWLTSRWGERLATGARQRQVALLRVTKIARREISQRKQAEQQAERRRQEAERLAELARTLNASLNLPVKSLLDTVAEACAQLLGANSVGFRLVDGEDLVLAGAWGDANAVTTLTRLKIGQSLSGVVAATGEPLLVRDPADDPRLIPAHREAFRQAGYRAVLSVPVKSGERVLGVLSIRSRRDEGFSAEHVALATAFASHVGVALENNRLYQETQQAYEELSQTQDQLFQAQKMEAIGQLAGGLAHDFNNLLTVIMARSQFLLNRLQPGDPCRRDAELIQTTAQRTVALIRQLLAFSRKQVLQRKVLDLNAVVGTMSTLLRPLLGEDISLVIAPGAGLGRVKADPAQIEQVFLNLAVNARDAMPSGGRLTITTQTVELDEPFVRRHRGARAGPHVMLAVSDTGIGMDGNTRARIFEPFFTTKAVGQGTGLGLSTVYGILKQHEGYIAVESQPGHGATFKMYLPCTNEPVEPAETASPPAEPPKGSETVLLAEDEADVRTLAVEILRTNGYQVLEASHPGEALRIVAGHAGPIHLLVTDVVMPDMSGPALAKRLRRERPDLKVLYISGYPVNALGHHGGLEPGATLLPKPFTPDALAWKLREVLDTPRTALV